MTFVPVIYQKETHILLWTFIVGRQSKVELPVLATNLHFAIKCLRPLLGKMLVTKDPKHAQVNKYN